MKGKINAKLVWEPQKQKEQLGKAQKFIDRKCLIYMKPYTPFRNGILEKSATLGTKIGSGRIVYNSPYARYQYYGAVYGPNIPIYENGELVGFRSPKKKYKTNRMIQYSTAKHPQAQRLWFETMKKKHGPSILRGVAALTGGKPSR